MDHLISDEKNHPPYHNNIIIFCVVKADGLHINFRNTKILIYKGYYYVKYIKLKGYMVTGAICIIACEPCAWNWVN